MHAEKSSSLSMKAYDPAGEAGPSKQMPDLVAIAE